MTSTFTPLPNDASITLTASLMAELRPEQLNHLAFEFARSGAYDAAYHLICKNSANQTDKGAKLASLALLTERSGNYMAPFSDPINPVHEAFIPYIAQELKSALLENFHGTDIQVFFAQPPAFIKKLASHFEPAQLNDVFIQSLEYDTILCKDMREWRRFEHTFALLPGLLERTIHTSMNLNKKHAERGSPGLLAAARMGDVNLFKSCLEVIKNQGIDPQVACIHQWLDKHTRNILPSQLTTRNTLTEALCSHNIELVQYILSICPKLQLDKEVLRVGEICDGLSVMTRTDAEKSQLMNTKDEAKSIQEAIEIGQAVKAASPQSPTQPEKRMNTL